MRIPHSVQPTPIYYPLQPIIMKENWNRLTAPYNPSKRILDLCNVAILKCWCSVFAAIGAACRQLLFIKLHFISIGHQVIRSCSIIQANIQSIIPWLSYKNLLLYLFHFRKAISKYLFKLRERKSAESSKTVPIAAMKTK